MLEKGDIARVIKGHFRMDDLMASSSYDPYAQERRDSWGYEDYRDATEGRCGFPWEHDEDEEHAPETSKYELGFVAMLLVDEMFGWNDAPASEYRQFLSDCGFNEATIDKLVPEHCDGKETEYILSY
jgi:hypothetical protein